MAERRCCGTGRKVHLAFCGVCKEKASSTLSLKTVRRTVFACLRQARSPSNPLLYLCNKKTQIPFGNLCFFMAERRCCGAGRRVHLAFCGACKEKASSTLSLKTVHRTVFACLRQARSLRIPFLSLYNMAERRCCGTGRKVHLACCGVCKEKTSSTLSLKTVRRTVFAGRKITLLSRR